MKTRPMQGAGGRIAVLLLVPLMMLNASQAMTLCVRGNGQVVLELLVEGRCACDLSTHGAETGEALTGAASHDAAAGGGPCMDIPIPTSTCDSRISVAAHAQPPCLPGCAGPEPAMSNPFGTVMRGSRVCPAYPPPLETISLQV